MSVKAIQTIHYGCDGAGCNAHGEGRYMPEGWLRVVVAPDSTGEKAQPTKLYSATLCPTCGTILRAVFEHVAEPKKEAEVAS